MPLADGKLPTQHQMCPKPPTDHGHNRGADEKGLQNIQGERSLLRSATVETGLTYPAGYAVPGDPLDCGRVAVVDFAARLRFRFRLSRLPFHGVSCQVIQPW